MTEIELRKAINAYIAKQSIYSQRSFINLNINALATDLLTVRANGGLIYVGEHVTSLSALKAWYERLGFGKPTSTTRKKTTKNSVITIDYAFMFRVFHNSISKNTAMAGW